MKDSEREIKAKIRRYLKTVDYLKVISYCPYPYGESGTPDLVGCYKGHMVLIEVKAPGKRLSVLQAKRKKEWEYNGATVIVAHCVDEVKEVINKLIKGE